MVDPALLVLLGLPALVILAVRYLNRRDARVFPPTDLSTNERAQSAPAVSDQTTLR